MKGDIMELATGIKGEKQIIVNEYNTALAMGSGALPVFATPAMIALMEATAAESIKDCLHESCSSVGISINVRHLTSTPVGAAIRCETDLVHIDRKKLTFMVRAFDDTGLVGEGTHERFIVENAPFMEKTLAKVSVR